MESDDALKNVAMEILYHLCDFTVGVFFAAQRNMNNGKPIGDMIYYCKNGCKEAVIDLDAKKEIICKINDPCSVNAGPEGQIVGENERQELLNEIKCPVCETIGLEEVFDRYEMLRMKSVNQGEE
jgi:hypothetical protein